MSPKVCGTEHQAIISALCAFVDDAVRLPLFRGVSLGEAKGDGFIDG